MNHQCARSLTLGLAVFLLASCSTTSDPYRKDAECLFPFIDEELLISELAAKPCCSSLKESLSQLKAEGRLRKFSSNETTWAHSDNRAQFLEVSRSSPIQSFGSLRSRFTAIEVEFAPGVLRSVDIVPSSSGTVSNAKSCSDLSFNGDRAMRYFWPSLEFLDERYESLGNSHFGKQVRAGGYIAFRHPVPTGTKFVVFHTQTDKVGSSLPVVSTPQVGITPIPGTGLYMAVPQQSHAQHRRASTGEFGVLLDLQSQGSQP
jgi:hypothetical protein